MEKYQEQIKKYAELAVKTGVNLTTGQTLVVSAPIEALPLVREITKVAYKLGAKYVHNSFTDDELTLIRYQDGQELAFEEAPKWLITSNEMLAEEGAAFLSIYAPNPDLLKDVSPERIAKWNKVYGQANGKYRAALMADKNRWSLVSVPTPSWASKVFPNDTIEVATDKLWNAIFEATRVNLENPIAEWDNHNAKLQKMVDFLNEKNFDKLVYKGEGTDLEVGLPKGHVWKGGSAKDQTGTDFNPNMPTEEVFTMPHKDRVNGVVSSTKPLNYAGNLIDQFTITFKDGQVVDYTAEVGYDTLKHLLETDEGAKRLGEVALVAHDSPISNSNIIFYNTLFDENASCHFAFGKAYPTNLKGGENMSLEELHSHGVNDSLVHVDYMVGNEKMNIDGITEDGTVTPLFRNGNWVI